MASMYDRDEAFDQMLDECYEPWTMNGMTYYPSDILYNCDPIAYHVGVRDYNDSRCSEGDHEDNGRGECHNCGDTIGEGE